MEIKTYVENRAERGGNVNSIDYNDYPGRRGNISDLYEKASVPFRG
jgi:hypothetical protein